MFRREERWESLLSGFVCSMRVRKGEELRFNLDPIDKKRARSECVRNLISKGVEWFYNSKVRAFEPENKES
jgi:hypothetical protein